MSKRTAESSPEQQEPAKKSKCAAESSPEQQETNVNEDHKFKPADVIFAACKKGETAQPDEFLVGSRFATGKEVESVDLATARVVLTGGMSGLKMALVYAQDLTKTKHTVEPYVELLDPQRLRSCGANIVLAATADSPHAASLGACMCV